MDEGLFFKAINNIAFQFKLGIGKAAGFEMWLINFWHKHKIYLS